MPPEPIHAVRRCKSGFTLIELSIVLVIIGLIVASVLVGQNLIRAAAVRATVTQIEKFNTAANTFYDKYGYLPGDLTAAAATQFGFTPRGTLAGQGDGNGFIQGNAGGGACGVIQDIGETVLFWQDLTYANGKNVNLIEGGFNIASTGGTFIGSISGTALATVLPQAKLGNNNYIYVYSTVCTGPFQTGKNFFGLSAVSTIYPDSEYSCSQCLASTAGLTVQQAYDIDRKVDDGLPTTGNTVAQFLAPNIFSSSGYGMSANAATASATTCYDTTSGNYSITVSGGSNVNCGLSFKLQAGD